MRGLSRLVIGVSLIACLATATTTPASACTPPPGGVPIFSVTEHVQAADVALEGTVVRYKGEPYQHDGVATLRVTRYFKGHGPLFVSILGYGPGSLCLSTVLVGDHAIFYAKGDPGERMRALYLSQGDALTAVTPETVAEAIAAAGHPPLTPDVAWIYLPILLK
jgi:hypothetical protein